ncbi:MAG: copper resistance protein CopC, partial [Burkholderiaceae bacterium]
MGCARRLHSVSISSRAASRKRHSPAAAHNSLVASNPADGAVLDSAPGEIVWTFAKSVPLDTLTVTLID